MSTSAKQPDLICFAVTANKGKDFFTRIGAAWKHKDGVGLNIECAAWPIDGKMVLFPPKADTEESEQTNVGAPPTE